VFLNTEDISTFVGFSWKIISKLSNTNNNALLHNSKKHKFLDLTNSNKINFWIFVLFYYRYHSTVPQAGKTTKPKI
jgi:hypothetical protein